MTDGFDDAPVKSEGGSIPYDAAHEPSAGEVRVDKEMESMLADKSFMKWLVEYEPDYYCTYSGTLLSWYDAWRAGRDLSSEVKRWWELGWYRGDDK